MVRQQSSRLVKGASAVAPCTNWSCNWYRWTSDSNFSYLSTAKSFSAHSIIDNSDNVLAGLTQAVRREYMKSSTWLAFDLRTDAAWIEVAPNGKYSVLFTIFGDLLLLDAKGGIVHRTKRSQGNLYSRGCWLPDSSGWLEYQFESNATSLKAMVLHPVRGKDRIISFRKNLHLLGQLFAISVGGISDKQIITSMYLGGGNVCNRVKIAIAPNDDVTDITVTHVNLPPTCKIYGPSNRVITPSPDGQRLLWMLSSTEGTRPVTDQAYISDSDGENYVLIGTGGQNETDSDYISSPQWLPDGTRISFIWQKSIWVFSVHIK